MLTLRNSVIDEKPFVIELGVMFHFTSTSLYRKFTFAIFFSGGAQIVNPTVHPVAGARVPVPRRQLPPAQLPQDEAGGEPHQGLQAQDQRRLPDLQTADRPLLLPRQAVPGIDDID